MVGRFEQINQVADLTLDETLGVDHITQLLRGSLEQRSTCVAGAFSQDDASTTRWFRLICTRLAFLYRSL